MDQTKHLQAIEAIKKKLRGRRLDYKEIYTLMDEISHDRLGDVLTAYFVASGFKDGFNEDELYYLTKAMVETGSKIEFPGIVADKHSIGGLSGARATMIIVPIVAAAGFYMPKTSSRAITSPAGTADVMEICAKVTFTPEQMKQIVNNVGGCIVWGGHLGIAPADDVIIRVEEPLSYESFDKVIVSIMAKKIAMSTNHLVLDIPLGPTMKIKYKKDADVVAAKFSKICKKFNIDVFVDIHNTTQPAGNGIGPYLEAVDVLKVLEQDKDRPMDLENRSLRLAGKLLDMCLKTAGKPQNGDELAAQILSDGSALKKFKEIVKAQHGDPDMNWRKPVHKVYHHEIPAAQSGTIKHINNYNLHSLAKVLGAPGDIYAGLYLNKRLDDKVSKNDTMFTFYASQKNDIEEAIETLKMFPIYTIES
ncbi:MAG: thymidine phosphorylase [Weeksellaceae bacterium]